MTAASTIKSNRHDEKICISGDVSCDSHGWSGAAARTGIRRWPLEAVRRTLVFCKDLAGRFVPAGSRDGAQRDRPGRTSGLADNPQIRPGADRDAREVENSGRMEPQGESRSIGGGNQGPYYRCGRGEGTERDYVFR